MIRLFRLSPAATALALLAACASPYEQCVNQVTRDLRALDQLIAQTEGNIARGYAIETEQYPVTYFDFCGGYRYAYLCQRTGVQTRRKPVTIDMELERRKLRDLRTIRREKALSAQAATAQCRAQHPAG